VAVLHLHAASPSHVTDAAYACLREVYVRQGTKLADELRRTPYIRTSQNTPSTHSGE
jgi:hypothetical protein